MLGLALLALLNGGLIGTSRAINARLGMAIGALHSSLWNHLVGFLFLAAMLIITVDPGFKTAADAPAFVYLGGVLGALFVAVNSHVLPRIGAVATLVLVISGQMISGMAIDYLGRDMLPTPAQMIGIALIMLGAYRARAAGSRRRAQPDAS